MASGLCGWIVAERYRFPSSIVLPMSVVVSEFGAYYIGLRPLNLEGLVYSRIGLTQIDMPWVAQSAAISGLTTLSVIVAAINGCVCDVIASIRRFPRVYWKTIGVSVTSIVGLSVFHGRGIYQSKPTFLEVNLLILPARVDEALHSVEWLPAMEKPFVAVFPEGAYDCDRVTDKPMNEVAKLLQNILGKSGDEQQCFAVIGANTHNSVSLSGAQVWNSVVVSDKLGHQLGTFDKCHLVPFREYEPWRLFGSGGPLKTRTFSRAVRTGRFSNSSLRNLDLRILTMICFDVCFDSTDGRPEFDTYGDLNAVCHVGSLTRLSDSWYPQLDYSFAKLQAIQLGVPVVKCTRDGWSGVISPSGLASGTSTSYCAGDWNAIVDRLPRSRQSTPYRKYGDFLSRATIYGVLTASMLAGLYRFLSCVGRAK